MVLLFGGFQGLCEDLFVPKCPYWRDASRAQMVDKMHCQGTESGIHEGNSLVQRGKRHKFEHIHPILAGQPSTVGHCQGILEGIRIWKNEKGKGRGTNQSFIPSDLMDPHQQHSHDISSPSPSPIMLTNPKDSQGLFMGIILGMICRLIFQNPFGCWLKQKNVWKWTKFEGKVSKMDGCPWTCPFLTLLAWPWQHWRRRSFDAKV